MKISTALNTLRWLMVVPAALVAWWLALAAGLLYVALLDRMCPAELVISGMCTASWYSAAFAGGIIAGAGLAATLIMATVILLAPKHKYAAATTTFAIGSAAAIYMGVVTAAWEATAAAVGCGLAVFLWFRSSLNRQV